VRRRQEIGGTEQSTAPPHCGQPRGRGGAHRVGCFGRGAFANGVIVRARILNSGPEAASDGHGETVNAAAAVGSAGIVIKPPIVPPPPQRWRLPKLPALPRLPGVAGAAPHLWPAKRAGEFRH